MVDKTKLSILIVDDSISMCSMMRSALVESGFKKVNAVNSARKALAMLKSTHIDLVLCDWNMPEMSGIDLLTEVRKYPKFINVRFIMVTGSNIAGSVKTALAYGVSDFIAKPFSPEILLSKIQALPVSEAVVINEDFKMLKILLVEDSLSTRALIKSLLLSLGVSNVQETDSAEDAQDWLKQGNLVDIVLCDWNMSDISGLDFLKWLRMKGATKHIPFVMITSENKQDKIDHAIAAGVDEYLIKPFRISELSNKISRLVGQ